MRAWIRKAWMLMRRDRFRSELIEEMEFHRAEAAGELLAGGMAPDAARAAAKRRFGNEARLREASHEAIAFRFESVWQDVCYALRQMMRAPGFTAAVVLTLALGIGANTAIFSVVQATLLRTLPYTHADRIVSVEDVRTKGVSTGGLVTVPRFFDLRARNKSFEAIACFYFEHPTLIYGTHLPEQMNGAAVSGQFWRVFGTQPLLGRVFDEREDRAHTGEVLVLSFSAWQRLFGGDAAVIGRVVTVDKNSATIIGVMPRSFDFPAKIDVWKPTHFDPLQWTQYRGDGVRFVNLAARLKPGVTLAQAQSELRVLGSQMGTEHPDTDAAWEFRSRGLKERLFGDVKPALLATLAASAILLLIACLNVANLLLSRATSRQREMAMRQALGASRARVVRQLLTESACLALGGGLVGLGAAAGLVRVGSVWMPETLRQAVTLDWQVVGFAVAVSLTTGILFGLAPVMHGRGGDLNESLKSGETRIAGAAGSRLRSAFIAVQVGLSLVLLVAASLLAESFWKLTRSPLGFKPDHVLTFEIQLPWGSNPGSFFDEVQRRLESLPGVVAVGQASALPTDSWHTRQSYDLDWKPRTVQQDTANVETRSVGGSYLEAMRIPLLAGRDLRANDTVVAMVNQAFVDRFLPGGNAAGRHLQYGGNVQVQIVGTIGNVRGTGGSVAEKVEPEVYFSNQMGNKRSFVVRSQELPMQLISMIREQVHEVDAGQSVGHVRTLDEMVDVNVAQPRLNMALLVAFAAIALALACVGIYGVVAYSVAQRRQEIGVRMALGATRQQISTLFLRRTVGAALVGMAAGIGAALLLTRLMRSQLYGVEPNDPRVYLSAILLLLVPVLLACLRPALRAASVNPVEALRME